MEHKATFRHLRRAPRKLRLVVDMVRGKPVQAAIDLLRFERKAASSTEVLKLIRSALANATQKPGVNPDLLYVKTIFVDQATIIKRFMPRAKGSASAIQKKTSHVTVILGEKI